MEILIVSLILPKRSSSSWPVGRIALGKRQNKNKANPSNCERNWSVMFILTPQTNLQDAIFKLNGLIFRTL